MIPKVVQAEYVRDHVIHIRFSDGAEGDVNFENELDGEIFAPLRTVAYFKRFSLHPELHTITWPNGADFAPEFLYERIQISA